MAPRGQVPASGGRGFRKSLRPPRLRPDRPPARRRARAQRIRVHPLPSRPWGPARTRSHVVRAVPLPAPRAPSRVGRPPPPWPVAPAAVIQQDCAPTGTAGARRPGCAVSHGAGRPAAALPTRLRGCEERSRGPCGPPSAAGRTPAAAAHLQGPAPSPCRSFFFFSCPFRGKGRCWNPDERVYGGSVEPCFSAEGSFGLYSHLNNSFP